MNDHMISDRLAPDFTLAMGKQRYNCSKAKGLIYGDDGSSPTSPETRGTKGDSQVRNLLILVFLQLRLLSTVQVAHATPCSLPLIAVPVLGNRFNRNA